MNQLCTFHSSQRFHEPSQLLYVLSHFISEFTTIFHFYVFVCRLFSKWNYHWSVVANGAATKGETSDFRKVTGSEDAEKPKPRIRFKIVPPPPKTRPEPRPPQPPVRTAAPKLSMQKRKVVVDVFGLHWKESWKSLKPPMYLYLKAKEKKTMDGFTTIQLTNSRQYKPTSQTEGTSLTDGWSRSWEQVDGRKVTTSC